jgi:pimeloyl-ACP methyl ester carboxylesterase
MQDWGDRDARPAGVRSEWLDVQGTRVRVLRHDGPGDPDATPFLLVHGLGGSATNWLEVMAGLGQRAPVAAVDLPGFGETAPPRRTAARVTANARFVGAFAAALGWDRVVLAGNSMGGMISVLVAARRPDLVERLVLLNPGLPAPVRAAAKVPVTALLTFAPFLFPGVGTRVLRARYRRMTPEQLYRQTQRLVYAEPERVNPALHDVGVEGAARGRELEWRLPAFVTAAESLMALLVGSGRPKIQRAIDAVACPTLLLWGDRDKLVGRPVIDGLVSRRPDWDSHTFEGVGHVPMAEVPDATLAVLGAWLDDQPLG